MANMLPIADRLKEIGCKCRVVDTSCIYHQTQRIPIDYRITINYELPISFYKLSPLNRILAVKQMYSLIIDLLNREEWDYVVIGNDGSLQRILIREAKKKNIRSLLLLDGIISDYNIRFRDVINYSDNKFKDTRLFLKNKCRKFLWHLLRSSSLSPYIHSEVGGTDVDEIITIGEYSKNVLIKNNSRSQIYALGLPRFWSNTPLIPTTPIPSSQTGKIVTYFPSAFKWHNLAVEHEWQQNDIRLLCELISHCNQNLEKCNRLQLNIKLHPREEKSDYSSLYKQYDFVKIIEDKTVEECLNMSILCLSTISTVIIEAMKIGKVVYSLMINFQYWRYKHSFIGDECISKIESIESLQQLLLESNQNFKNNSKLLFKLSDRFCNSVNNMEKIVNLIMK